MFDGQLPGIGHQRALGPGIHRVFGVPLKGVHRRQIDHRPLGLNQGRQQGLGQEERGAHIHLVEQEGETFGDKMITGNTFSGSGVTPVNRAKIDFMAWVDRPATPAPNYYDASDCASVVDLLTKNLFATELNANQKNFLIDTIFMQSESRDIWTTQWNLYKTATPANLATRTTTVRVRMENVMKFLFRMAEYQIF